MKSLADFLGVQDPSLPEDKPTYEKQAPSPKLSVKDFAKNIIHSATYREHLMRMISVDELPPAVECMLWHYAYGKPVERVEFHENQDPLEEMDAEACEQRAMQLIEVARQMRQAERAQDPEPEECPADVVH